MPSTLPIIQSAELAACCSLMSAEVVSDEDAKTLARMLKALSDPTRVKLLSMIAAAPEGEACICDMTGTHRTEPAHHLAPHEAPGRDRLVTREQRGQWACYRVVPEVLRSLSAALWPAAD